jgi:hypothetical protein
MPRQEMNVLCWSDTVLSLIVPLSSRSRTIDVTRICQRVLSWKIEDFLEMHGVTRKS